MRDVIHLVATRSGVVRMVKRSPLMARDEIGVRLRIEIPDGCFLAPILSVDIDVEEQQVIQPKAQVEVLDLQPEAVS